MNTAFISASELKRNTADVLNRVYYEKIVAVIKRHDEPIVKISPIDNKDKKKNTASLLLKYYGILPDFPAPTMKRSRAKRNINL